MLSHVPPAAFRPVRTAQVGRVRQDMDHLFLGESRFNIDDLHTTDGVRRLKPVLRCLHPPITGAELAHLLRVLYRYQVPGEVFNEFLESVIISSR